MKRLLCLLAALAVLLPRGHAAEPRCVALTFDDGPSGALTERLLDGLAARGVHATFFSAATGSICIRSWPRASPPRDTRPARTATRIRILLP